MTRLFASIAVLCAGCADLTMPASDDGAVAVASPKAPAPSAAEPTKPAEKRVRLDREERVGASHVLIAYKGSRRAKEGIDRSKREAKARALEVKNKADKGEDFAKLAKEYSDGPSAGKGGDLGMFGRQSMVKPFSDAAFELEVGKVSDVVETEFGFHVIKRTK